MIEQIAVLLLALVSGLLATLVARKVAIAVGLVDHPDGRRKIQRGPVAICGGVGVFVGATFGLLVAAAWFPNVEQALRTQFVPGLALFVAAILVATTGFADDLINLRARYKLVGQIAAALVVVYGGNLVIHQVTVFGMHVDLGPLAVPATVLWLLFAINALNLLDGMDGFLGTVGVVAFAALSAMAFAREQPFVGYLTLAMAGAMLGFLRFNLPPATVYLGDCGSHLIGLVVGTTSLMASLKGPTVAILAPAALLVLPLIDTSAAVVRRKLTGRGLALADRGHLHHVLLRTGIPPRRVLALVAALGGLAGVGAWGSLCYHNDLFAAVAGVAVVLVLLAGGLFGNAEFRLVRERLFGAVRSARARAGTAVESEVRLQGTADWSALWLEISRAAADLDLRTVCLDVNAPAWHEGYHHRWDRSGRTVPEYELWRVELPLFGLGQVIGRLTVVGERDDVPVTMKLAALCKIVASAEERAVMVADSVAISSPTRETLPDQPLPAGFPPASVPFRVRATA